MAQFDDVAGHPAVAAGFGAFVSLVLARKMTALQSLISWLAGFFCAIYIAPAVINGWPDMAKWVGAGGIYFAVGAFGLQFTAMLYDVISVIRENPRATLTAVFDILLKRKG
ncbi:MAG: hypothetical protein ING73_11230 [Rhodocyclaceae bacterium]|nr:hypothetical protein [Rhodocyclaceae bacterium]